MLKVLGYETLDALIDAAVPDSVRSLGELDLPPAASEREVLDELRQLASSNVHRRAHDRPGLLRHDHAGRDQAERAREPGLVHGVHPVPTRDQPGTPGGPPQLPDDGGRSHRARYGERLAARRGHGGGRGRHAHAPPRHGRVAPGGRRRRLPAADHRDPGDAARAARDPRRRRRPRCRAARGRVLRPGAAVSGMLGCPPRLRRPHRRGAPEGRDGHRGDGPPGSDAAEAAGALGSRRRRRLLPALRRPAVVRRPARRLHGRQGRARARPARPSRRAVGRRRGPSGLPAGAADA